MNTRDDNARPPTAPVRIGLVGLGGHGRTIQHAVAEADRLSVVAVYDPVETERRASAERFDCEAAPSYDALLNRNDLEAVVLVTPNHIHRQQAEAAFAAGRDVFVEKPLANTVADGRAMIDAAQAAGRILTVGHNMRYGRATQWARHLLTKERLGTVVSFEIHFSSDAARHLPREAWRLQPERCPMLPVMQLGIHAIDLMHYLIGNVEEVYALARSVTTPPGAIDNVCATLRLASGVMGTLVSNYCSPICFEYRITGTEGTLRCTPHSCWFQSASDADSEGRGAAETHDFQAYDLERWVRLLHTFADAVRTRIHPEVDGWTGLRALAVVEAMQRSAEAGHSVQVDSVYTRNEERRLSSTEDRLEQEGKSANRKETK